MPDIFERLREWWENVGQPNRPRSDATISYMLVEPDPSSRGAISTPPDPGHIRVMLHGPGLTGWVFRVDATPCLVDGVPFFRLRLVEKVASHIDNFTEGNPRSWARDVLQRTAHVRHAVEFGPPRARRHTEILSDPFRPGPDGQLLVAAPQELLTLVPRFRELFFPQRGEELR